MTEPEQIPVIILKGFYSWRISDLIHEIETNGISGEICLNLSSLNDVVVKPIHRKVTAKDLT